MERTGDGWTTCSGGHRHWGRFGAAGLLVRRPSPAGGSEVLLQLRAAWSHHGGTWGLPGGARDASEDEVATALRESAEEVSLDPRTVRPVAVFGDDHGGWRYDTVVADVLPEAARRLTLTAAAETDAVRWVHADRVAEMTLHPGFATSWPRLRELPAPPRILVDAANVVGSRPDGWWRDRRGAAIRLRDELAAAAGRWSAGRMPVPWCGDAELHWLPQVIMVVERQARGVEAVPGVEVIGAQGSGDDALVALLADRALPSSSSLVVTADRELADRVSGRGAVVAGPRWLLDLISAERPQHQRH